METKNYYRYWISLIEEWFVNNDVLTKEKFLKIQQMIKQGYKISDKVYRMKQIDFMFKNFNTNNKDFDNRLKFLFTKEEIKEYKKLKGIEK